jgi:NitT/TauT family transport system permease protein
VKRNYFSYQNDSKRSVGLWDLFALIVIVGLIFLLAWAGQQMSSPYHLGEPIKISLEPSALPSYALRTVFRMFIALIFSLLFTFIFGTLAAKSRQAEKLIIPAIDVLQSVPVLSFLSITVVGFIKLFPNSLLGPECASIFAIFTAQAWNMALAFYQSLKTLPHELLEASHMFQLSSWQRFWKVEVPFSLSPLLWNMMMSMSASWFFVVLSEAISVSNQDIRLPGVGSYIAVAIEQANTEAVLFAILGMLIVIVLYDQLLFRPLLAWSEKFKIEDFPTETPYSSWFVNLLVRANIVKALGEGVSRLTDLFINARVFRKRKNRRLREINYSWEKRLNYLWNALLGFFVLCSGAWLMHFILAEVSWREVGYVLFLGMVTSIRVVVCIVISSVVWIPIGVYIGKRVKLAKCLQPVIQILAAFPANLIYPVVVIAIVTYQLNTEIWLTPLMILGTQWYILFNVIAGAMNIPRELNLAASNLQLKGWLWWKRLALPAIFPYFITGVVTAAGGAWNASIVAEWVSWGPTTVKAIGLGAYIHQYTNAGDFPKIALGTSMMCLFVLAFNQLLWRPLYRLAESRYNLN